jgi:hypothetical protein
MPGFYYIPGYSRYVISKTATVINVLSGRELKPHIGHQGYCSISLTSDLGDRVHFARHRLMGSMFKSADRSDLRWEINHINGIKGDDRLENLEWVTSSENTKHAFAINKAPIPVPVSSRNVKTGEVRKYPTIRACALDNQIDRDRVLVRLNRGEKYIAPELKQYRYGHSDDPWYIPTEKEIADVQENGGWAGIFVRNVITNKITGYKKAKLVAEKLGISPSTLTQWLKRKDQPVLPGYIQLKYYNDPTPWRVVENPEKEMLEFGCNRQIVRYNQETGESIKYNSLKECAISLKAPISSILWRVQRNCIEPYKDGFTYNYYYPETTGDS